LRTTGALAPAGLLGAADLPEAGLLTPFTAAFPAGLADPPLRLGALAPPVDFSFPPRGVLVGVLCFYAK
jgi:hypothetical protein